MHVGYYYHPNDAEHGEAQVGALRARGHRVSPRSSDAFEPDQCEAFDLVIVEDKPRVEVIREAYAKRNIEAHADGSEQARALLGGGGVASSPPAAPLTTSPAAPAPPDDQARVRRIASEDARRSKPQGSRE